MIERIVTAILPNICNQHSKSETQEMSMRKSTVVAALVGTLLLGIGAREASARVIIRICQCTGNPEVCGSGCGRLARSLLENTTVQIGDQEFREGIMDISDLADGVGSVQITSRSGETLFFGRVSPKEIVMVDHDQGFETSLDEVLQ